MNNTRAKSFVTIMIVIALVAFVLRLALSSIIKITIVQNESQAQSALKLITAALENYAQDNQGAYPAQFRQLTQTKSGNLAPYLDADYLSASGIKGYNFSCPRLEASGYSCSAQPILCKFTGSKTYTITTGSPLIEEECDKKEQP
jgi:type II secretory pathway pseudopilin PulG